MKQVVGTVKLFSKITYQLTADKNTQFEHQHRNFHTFVSVRNRLESISEVQTSQLICLGSSGIRFNPMSPGQPTTEKQPALITKVY